MSCLKEIELKRIKRTYYACLEEDTQRKFETVTQNGESQTKEKLPGEALNTEMGLQKRIKRDFFLTLCKTLDAERKFTSRGSKKLFQANM